MNENIINEVKKYLKLKKQFFITNEEIKNDLKLDDLTIDLMKTDSRFNKFYINVDIYENHIVTDENEYTYILFELKR